MESGITLLQRYRETSSAEAFALLAQRYGGMVYSAALRVTGNTHDAEDVAQECFLTLARQAGTIRSSVSGWLHSLAVSRAKNLCREHTRRRKREATAMGTPDSPSWSEISPRIDEAIQDLPDDHRIAIIARFLEGRTQSELAEEWGVNQSTVSRRIEKALDSLRALLRRRGIPVAAGAVLLSLLENAAEAVPATLTAGLGKIAVSGIGASSKTASGVLSTKAVLGASIAAFVAAAAIAAVVLHEPAGGRRPEMNPASAAPPHAAELRGNSPAPTTLAPAAADTAMLQEPAGRPQLGAGPSPALPTPAAERTAGNLEPLAAADGEFADVKTLRALLSQAIIRFVEQKYAYLPEHARREMLAEADMLLTPGTYTIAMEGGGQRTASSDWYYPELRIQRAQLPTVDDIVGKMLEHHLSREDRWQSYARGPGVTQEYRERVLSIHFAWTEAGAIVLVADSSLKRLCWEKRR